MKAMGQGVSKVRKRPDEDVEDSTAASLERVVRVQHAMVTMGAVPVHVSSGQLSVAYDFYVA